MDVSEREQAAEVTIHWLEMRLPAQYGELSSAMEEKMHIDQTRLPAQYGELDSAVTEYTLIKRYCPLIMVREKK